MHKMQVEALNNARSVTDRVFIKEDQAQSHHQIENMVLALMWWWNGLRMNH